MESTFFSICKKSAVLPHENYLAARNCTAHTLTRLSCLVSGVFCLFVFKERTKDENSRFNKMQFAQVLRSISLRRSKNSSPNAPLKR